MALPGVPLELPQGHRVPRSTSDAGTPLKARSDPGRSARLGEGLGPRDPNPYPGAERRSPGRTPRCGGSSRSRRSSGSRRCRRSAAGPSGCRAPPPPGPCLRETETRLLRLLAFRLPQPPAREQLPSSLAAQDSRFREAPSCAGTKTSQWGWFSTPLPITKSLVGF